MVSLGLQPSSQSFKPKNFQFLLRVFNGVHVVAANSGNFLNLDVVAAATDDHFDEAEGGVQNRGRGRGIRRSSRSG
ncbi:hypothetical protein ACE6H2_015466 [Prunus campanulata]